MSELIAAAMRCADELTSASMLQLNFWEKRVGAAEAIKRLCAEVKQLLAAKDAAIAEIQTSERLAGKSPDQYFCGQEVAYRHSGNIINRHFAEPQAAPSIKCPGMRQRKKLFDKPRYMSRLLLGASE